MFVDQSIEKLALLSERQERLATDSTLVRLEDLARSLGGSLEFVSLEAYLLESCPAHEEDESFSEAPFVTYRMGINYAAKRVLVCVKDKLQVKSTHVIHEMAHVFASPFPPDHPDISEQVFLGWEFATAFYVGIGVDQWVAENSQYNIERHTEIGSLPKERVVWHVQDRLRAAMRVGAVDHELRPRTIREKNVWFSEVES